MININLAGAFCKHKILTLLIFKYKFNYSVFDGVEYCKWNGGRVNKCNPFDPKILEYYNKKNIPLYFTFSNPNIDLNDTTGNFLLEQIKDYNNGCIIVNDNLREYIRSKYPNLKLIYSVTGHPNNPSVDIKYLKDLEKRYDLIVPRYEWTFNPEFYNNVDVSKYEIMINDTCKYNCELWNDHFSAIAKLNEQGDPYCDTSKKEIIKIRECWIPGFNPSVGSEEDRQKYGDCLGMDLSVNALKNAIKIGYKHFKIMGRENSNDVFFAETSDFLDRIQKALGLNIPLQNTSHIDDILRKS